MITGDDLVCLTLHIGYVTRIILFFDLDAPLGLGISNFISPPLPEQDSPRDLCNLPEDLKEESQNLHPGV